VTVSELAVLGGLLAVTAFTFFVVFEVVPSLARDRLVDQLCGLRRRIRQLEEVRPGAQLHPGVISLDSLMQQMLRRGEPLGVALLAAAWVERSRRPARQQRVDYRGLSQGDQIVLEFVERQFAYEVIRSTLLGSRLWFLVWPGWLLVSSILAPHIAAGDAHDESREGRRAESAGNLIIVGVTSLQSRHHRPPMDTGTHHAPL